MIKDYLIVGLPSKGRLKDKSINLLRKNNVAIRNSGREYLSEVKNNKNIKIIYSHAREIIERLADGSIDIGISGLDLLKETAPGIQKKIKVIKKLNFGFADLVVAVPKDWIDVQTMADLEEISFTFNKQDTGKLRVATKYPNLTNEFFESKGLYKYKIVNSLGSTEVYPYTNQSELITDITSSGKTLRANKLRILKDGNILSSSACILASSTSLKNKNKKTKIKSFLNKIKKNPK
mgnify:FL=1